VQHAGGSGNTVENDEMENTTVQATSQLVREIPVIVVARGVAPLWQYLPPAPVIADASASQTATLSAVEQERLEQLREGYPAIEFTESASEWQRLRFLKWCVASGRCARG
jgi:hypothetical protein